MRFIKPSIEYACWQSGFVKAGTKKRIVRKSFGANEEIRHLCLAKLSSLLVPRLNLVPLFFRVAAEIIIIISVLQQRLQKENTALPCLALPCHRAETASSTFGSPSPDAPKSLLHSYPPLHLSSSHYRKVFTDPSHLHHLTFV